MAWAIDQLKSKAKVGDWRGLGAFVIRAMYERYYEWRFDIQSGGYIDPGALGIANEESVGYEGTDYRSLSDIMVKLQVRERSDVFLDLGAGKGRAVIMAATQPFHRIIGVEISPELVAIAQRNLARARKRLVCTDIDVVTADATTFVVPDDVTVVFMFNPFRGDVLAHALQNVKASLNRAPRAIRVVFVNPRHVDAEIRAVMAGWLSQREVFTPIGAEFSTVIYEGCAPIRGSRTAADS